jgi:hypothetical protein
MTSVDYSKLLEQIQNIQDETQLKDYHAFVYWFIETAFGYDRNKILNSICDGMHDKGVDAILVDSIEKRVTFIQSKFEQAGGQTQLKEGDIKQFAAVREYFKTKKALAGAITKANQVATRLFNEAFEAIHTNHYSQEFIFITTHRSAPQIEKLITDTLGFKVGQFAVYHYGRIMQLLSDQLRDFTPLLAAYNLPYKDADQTIVRSSPSAQRSWVLTVPNEEIRAMVNKYGDNLFRKNIRNFLGFGTCNARMRDTLNNEPNRFWYYNNGICMICDEAQLVVESKYIHLNNPQIVNGCQTAQTIAKFPGDIKGEVLVRVIESRDHEFIDAITLYQNSSNKVLKRDFKSNDPVQVRLKREFRRHGYYYEIKRGEEYSKMARKYPALKTECPNVINNEEVAKVLAAIKLGPHIATSKGSEDFFDDLYNYIFPNNISTFNCLAPKVVYDVIKGSYAGQKKRFHSFDKPFKFKNRAAFHVLRLIYEAINNEKVKDWEKKLALLDEMSSKGDKHATDLWNQWWDQMVKVISRYFELIHKAWQRERRLKRGELEVNQYVQSKASLGQIKKNYAREVKSLANQTKKIFRDTVFKIS